MANRTNFSTVHTNCNDDGLQTPKVLVESRSEAKKAVIVVTDGRSNIGPPPVRVARELLALYWDDSDGSWDVEKYGPQVEIYAFSVADANKVELESIASRLPAHVFRLSTFSMFAEFAHCLHGGLTVLFSHSFNANSFRGRLMSTSESYGIKGNTTRCSRLVFVGLQLWLVSS